MGRGWIEIKKTYVRDVFNVDAGCEAELLGWVDSFRVHGGVSFIFLRDSTGLIQVTLRKNEMGPLYDELVRILDREASIYVRGVVRLDERAPGGRELVARDVRVIGASKDFPIRKNVGPRFLLDNRHLYLRRPKPQAILRLREMVFKAAREWFGQEGYVEVQAPIFITAAVEGGATLFPVKYFGRTAYLSQSTQFYLEAAIYAFEKVYSIQPCFRAEKSRTRKHLTEFWHIEAEVAFATHDDIMKVEEELLYHITSRLVEWGRKELRILGREDFKPPEPPYPRIKYDEAVELVNSKGVRMEWGEDFGAEAERIISTSFEKPVFITGFPLETRAFYHMPDPDNPGVTLSSDLYAPEGMGELTTGGQRIHQLDLLLRRIKEEGLNVEDYKWYVDLRKYGSVPHSGFGLGVERLLRWVGKLEHIREATMFPRTPARVYP